jgi:uncharacterized coiled-coil protein SlyX
MAGGPNFSNRALSAEAKANHDADQKVNQIAMRLRTLGAENPNYAKTEEELKAAVKAAFEARQAMQKAEIKRLKDKLAEIEAHVARREGAKDVLIEERVFELKSSANFGGTNAGFPPPASFPMVAPVGSTGIVPAGDVPLFDSNTLPPTQPGPFATQPAAAPQVLPPTEPAKIP